MNQIFKNSKKIKLDELYSLEPDGYHGLILIFQEERTRTKKDGTDESFLYNDKWYFPKTSQTLSYYLNLKLGEAKDLEDIRDILERVENKIEQIKEKW